MKVSEYSLGSLEMKYFNQKLCADLKEGNNKLKLNLMSKIDYIYMTIIIIIQIHEQASQLNGLQVTVLSFNKC